LVYVPVVCRMYNVMPLSTNIIYLIVTFIFKFLHSLFTRDAFTSFMK